MLPMQMTPEMISMITQMMAMNTAPQVAPALMMPNLSLPLFMCLANNVSPQQVTNAYYQQLLLMNSMIPSVPAVKTVSVPQSPNPPPPVMSPSGNIVTKRKSSEDLSTEPAKKACSLTIASPTTSDTYVPSSTPIITPSVASSSDADDEYIDVVGDTGPRSKAHRKGHIEFYRKVKSLRNRAKILTCALCSEAVQNVENNVKTHVTTHATSSMLICKLCGNTTGDLHQMFEHMATRHPPSARSQYEDKRDMNELCEILMQCFPRNTATKTKLAHVELISKLVENVKTAKMTEIDCAMCSTSVSPDLIMKHVTNHHPYRCKKCKHIEHDESAITEHVKSAHNETAPRMGIHFHVSAASDAIVTVIKRCFSSHLTSHK